MAFLKANCPACDKYAFLLDKEGNKLDSGLKELPAGALCKDCSDKINPKKEQPDTFNPKDYDPVGSRHKATPTTALATMKKAKQDKRRVMTITDDYPDYDIEVLDMEDFGWAFSVMEVFQHNFETAKAGVFTNLVIVSTESGMFFTPPNTAPEKYAGPTITITDPETYRKEQGASLPDWIGTICHEIIHYLHWRWTILPLSDSDVSKYYHGYEEDVTGATALNRIPLFEKKMAEGLKELKKPQFPFTENGFRQKFKVPPRVQYGDGTTNGKPGDKAMLKEHYPVSRMFLKAKK